MVVLERLLHRMQLAALREALDGRDVGAVAGDRERRAGLDRLAVDMDDAGAALRGVAADMRAGQAQVFAQELNQQRARINIGGNGLAVHRHRNLHHSRFPPNEFRASPRFGLLAAPTNGRNRAETLALYGREMLARPSAGRQLEKGADMLV